MKKHFFILLFASFSFLSFAQSADKITEILNTEKLTFSQAAYICASATDDGISEEDAFSKFKSEGIIAEKISPTDEINIRNFSYICANTWNVKGSLFLAMFKNPRYAFRQLKADGVINDGADGSKKLNGHEALNIVTECINLYDLK